MIKISSFLDPSRIIELKSGAKDVALKELADRMTASPLIGDAVAFRECLYQRESIMSTGLGLGIAVPHVRHATVKEMLIGVGISRQGLEFDSLDKKPVHIVVMVASPEASHREYLHVLAKLTSVLQDEEFRDELAFADVPHGVWELLKDK